MLLAVTGTSSVGSMIFESVGIEEKKVSKIGIGELKNFTLNGLYLNYSLGSIAPVSIWETSEENFNKVINDLKFKTKQCLVGKYMVNVLYK